MQSVWRIFVWMPDLESWRNVLTPVKTPCYCSYMNTNTAANAAATLVATLVAKGMTKEAAASYVVNRMISERPELAAKVFAGLVAA